MKKIKVSVLGAGNGGQALSAHLAIKGCEVNLFEHPKFKENIKKINKKGGIELTGKLKGFGKISIATTNIKEAIEDTSVIMIVAPSFAQRPLIELSLPYLNSQIIILIPGNFGSFEIKKILKDNGKDLTIAETNSLPYACRKIEEGKVNVWGVKSYISVATLPAVNIKNVIEILNDFFPIPLHPVKNSLEISFSNPNMIVHCPTMILNAGRIESTKGNFMFYCEGMTESVCKTMEKMDEERIQIGKKLNLSLISTYEWLKQTYNLKGKSLYEVISTSPVYSGHGPDAPGNLNHRYITEDIPHLLVPVASFGRLLGIQATIIECIIKLASAINGVDYFKNGRNLETLGLSGMSLEKILAYI
jgi:opine dehydrogenase